MRHHHVMAQLGTGGIEYFVAAVAKEQRRRGDLVNLWLLTRPDGLASGRLADQQECELQEAGVEVGYLNAGNRSVARNTWRLYRTLLNQDKDRHDVWHAHCAVAVPIILLASRIQPILWLHNTDFEFPRRIMSFLGAFTSTYVASSDSVRASWLSTLGDEIRIVPYGLEPQLPPPQHDISRTVRRFLMIARLEKQKRVDRFLLALSELRMEMGQEADWLRFTIVGDGSQRLELARLTRELGLEPFVEFVGAQSDLHHFFRSSDVFVLSSDFEGTPIALLQAVAAGLPVVITPFPGGVNFICEFGCGLVSDGFSSSALAAALLRLCRDNDTLAMLRLAAAQAATCISVERSVDLIARLPQVRGTA